MTNKLKGKARAKNSKKQNRLKKIRIESTIRDLQRCILTHDASSLYEPSLDVIIEDDLSKSSPSPISSIKMQLDFPDKRE